MDELALIIMAKEYTINEEIIQEETSYFLRYISHTNTCNINLLRFFVYELQLLDPPECGNGFVEAGEECDCGTSAVSPPMSSLLAVAGIRTTGSNPVVMFLDSKSFPR